MSATQIGGDIVFHRTLNSSYAVRWISQYLNIYYESAVIGGNVRYTFTGKVRTVRDVTFYSYNPQTRSITPSIRGTETSYSYQNASKTAGTEEDVTIGTITVPLSGGTDSCTINYQAATLYANGTLTVEAQTPITVEVTIGGGGRVQIKVNGEWCDASVYSKVGGEWVQVSQILTKQGGEWIETN